MPRLREIPRAEVTDERTLKLYDLLFGDRDPVAQPGTDTGTRGDWWTVFAGSPDVLRHAAQGFALYRDPARKLDPVLRGPAGRAVASSCSLNTASRCAV
jgi:hypothetical protein